MGEDAVEEGPETDGGYLRPLRIKSPFVVGSGSGGNSLVGLDERDEMLVRSLLAGVEIGVVVASRRKRRMPWECEEMYWHS